MKKLLFVVLAVIAFQFSSNAQTFKIGPNIGYAVGDAGDFHSIVIGADAYYYFTDIDSFLEIGLTGGFRAYTGEESIDNVDFTVPNQSYLPVGIAGRVKLLDVLSAGADLGYAFGLSDYDGGFYFRPVVGFDIADTVEIFACFEYISAGTDDPIGDFDGNFDFDISYTSIGVGILFEF